MLSNRGVDVMQTNDIRTLSIARPLPCSLRIGNYLSSVRPIPVEVMSNIFGFTSDLSQDPISQSTVISHVCRQWRWISLSMPSLWTSILLSLPLAKNQLARMSTWIVRSRNQPLDISMDFRDPSWDWDEASHVFTPKEMDRIMRFLVPHASRWRSIELLTDTWAPIFSFLAYTVAITSAPLLENVRLARCNEYFVAQGEVFRPANLALPIAWFGGGVGLRHLRHVSLSGVHVDWTQFGLTGLRELELRYHARDVMPTLSDFRRILSANAELRRLVILGWGPRMDHVVDHERRSDEVQTVDLSPLEELEFGFVDVAYATRFLSLLVLPNLRVLSIEDVAYGIHLDERQDCSSLFYCLVGVPSTTIRVSSCIPLSSLRAFSLRSVYADDASIHSLFGYLGAMTSLCLDRVGVSPLLAICSALDACARLQVLTLKDMDSAATGVVLASCSFPTRLRIFLDIEDTDQVEGDDNDNDDDD